MSLARFSLWIQARKKRRKAQQSRRKFAPAVSTTRAGDAAVSKSEDAAEVQLSSLPGPQPIQSGAPSRHKASLQAETLCGLGRVARSRGIDRRSRDGGRAARRRASVPLTPPAALLFVRADSRAVLAARACEELQTVASWALTDGHIGECRLTERFDQSLPFGNRLLMWRWAQGTPALGYGALPTGLSFGMESFCTPIRGSACVPIDSQTAGVLNGRRIATVRGGRWEAATVANVLRRVSG
jgi:hypothetical protein